MAEQGVLLYYKYVRLDPSAQVNIQAFYRALCTGLQQCGRVRVAADGINVTVGGSMGSLQEHAAAVKGHPLLQGSDIDFKLARSDGPRSEGAKRDSGFDTLAVNVCKELVSLGPNVKHRGDPFAHGAPHLTPQQFHNMLSQGAAPDGRPLVLLDARNVYETAIGYFDAPGVQRLDPCTRSFGELPSWVDTHASQLRDKRVLMYCTGGVRCERASALLRELGEGFQDVYQLAGGIQRYLEAFPDGGGLYRGGLFVYDERCSVAPEGDTAGVVGRCLGCNAPWDDYGARSRCSSCRMLVLLCPNCQHLGVASPGVQCMLCLKRKAKQGDAPAGAEHKQQREQERAVTAARKLRLLCLHGFRQTGKQLQISMRALESKLSDLAEFVYVDAPHELPCYFKPRSPRVSSAQAEGAPGSPTPSIRNGAFPSSNGMHPDTGREQGGHGFVVGSSPVPIAGGAAAAAQGSAGSGVHADAAAADAFVPGSLPSSGSPGSYEAAGSLHFPANLRSPARTAPSDAAARAAATGGAAAVGGVPASPRRRAWLVALGIEHTPGGSEPGTPVAASPRSGWLVAPPECDARQYTRQTAGWHESLAAIQEALANHGPFDGVVGVSQGAAIAAVLCALQQEQQQQRQQGQQEQQGGAVSAEAQGLPLGFRFAVLADGFLSPCPEHQALLQRQAPLQLPSLHTWNTSGAGRRIISAEESERLASLFQSPKLLHHKGGHMLPPGSQQVQELRTFLAAQASTKPEPLQA